MVENLKNQHSSVTPAPDVFHVGRTLNEHYEDKHKPASLCVVPECNYKWTRKYVFKKHLKMKHHLEDNEINEILGSASPLVLVLPKNPSSGTAWGVSGFHNAWAKWKPQVCLDPDPMPVPPFLPADLPADLTHSDSYFSTPPLRVTSILSTDLGLPFLEQQDVIGRAIQLLTITFASSTAMWLLLVALRSTGMPTASSLRLGPTPRVSSLTRSQLSIPVLASHSVSQAILARLLRS